MRTVAYNHDFSYSATNGGAFPVLQIGIQAAGGGDGIDIDAYIDSGSTNSLFEGSIVEALGLALMDGPERTYMSTSGVALVARIHSVRLAHDALGTFELDVGFSTAHISRNLLGRDFFNLIQIGFREHELRFFVEPKP